MDEDKLLKILHKVAHYKSPISWVIAGSIIILAMLQDIKYKYFIGPNSVLIVFNVILYLMLAHMVFTYQTKKKIKDIQELIKSFENYGIDFEFINDEKHAQKLEKKYLYLLGIAGILFLLLSTILFTNRSQLNPLNIHQLLISLWTIVLTASTECFLIFHVLDIPFGNLCTMLNEGIMMENVNVLSILSSKLELDFPIKLPKKIPKVPEIPKVIKIPNVQNVPDVEELPNVPDVAANLNTL